jgi:hypothetical protein
MILAKACGVTQFVDCSALLIDYYKRFSKTIIVFLSYLEMLQSLNVYWHECDGVIKLCYTVT